MTDVAEVFTLDSGLWAHHGLAPRMAVPHRHDDLELNAVFSGRLEYHWAGTRIAVEEGEIALFWGATPHRLADPVLGRDTEAGWIHIPLPTVLGWGLLDRDVALLFEQRPIVVPSAVAGQDAGAMIDRWCADVDGDDESRSFAMIEAEALVRRLLRSARDRPERAAEHPVDDASRHAATMARFLAERFRDRISPADVVAVVHLAPRYAMTVFRRSTGMTLGAYLIRCRVAEAQRLLITSSMTTSEIAHAAGFGSQSSLYAHFGRETGMSPARYRRTH